VWPLNSLCSDNKIRSGNKLSFTDFHTHFSTAYFQKAPPIAKRDAISVSMPIFAPKERKSYEKYACVNYGIFGNTAG
jgi:hypothetical protein